MEFQLPLKSTPFNLDHTLDCGQVFRWMREDGWWIGVVDGNVVKLKQIEDTLTVKCSSDDADERFVTRYLRLDDPLPDILTEIRKDELTANATSRLDGLRLIRQDPWECTASFICATYKNIRTIRQMISNLCQRLGTPIEFEGTTYHSFPTPEAIADADRSRLTDCGLGYRAKFLIETARNIASNAVALDDLARMDYPAVRHALLAHRSGKKTLPGVGPKVADCIMLFSLEKLDAFPIDVWIRRAVLRFYRHLFDGDSLRRMVTNLQRNFSIGLSEYTEVSQTMRTYFGTYAGYAQEYLYHYTRIYEPLLLTPRL